MIMNLFKTKNITYPLMRDPERKPKCYEFTDQEREAAIQRLDLLLRKRTVESTPEI